MDQIQPQSNTNSPMLFRLPLEVLLLIFKSFCFHCHAKPDAPYPEARYVQDSRQWPHASPDPEDRKALHSLCLVSKHTRDIAQGMLYHDIRLESREHLGSFPADWRLPDLIQTIISRPDLARLAKNLHVHRNYRVALWIDNIRDVCQLAADALGLDLPAIWFRRERNMWVPEPKEMESFFLGTMNDIDRVGVGAHEGEHMVTELLSMLLALLPNLEHVNIEPELPSLEAMRALGVTRLPWKEMTLSESSRLIRMTKNLETLTLTRSTSGLSIPTSLKTLRIHCQEDIQHLRDYLQHCTALTSFSFQASCESRFDSGSAVFAMNVGAIIPLLHRFRESLKSLYLDIRYRHCGYPMLKTKHPVGSLKEFTVLEDLLLSTNSVCPTLGPTRDMPSDEALVDILPSSIVRLNLVYPDGWIDDKFKKALLGLADSLKCNKAQFPNLKTIRRDSWKLCEGDDSAIRKAFEQVGVDLMYKEFPRYDWGYETDPDGFRLPNLRCNACRT